MVSIQHHPTIKMLFLRRYILPLIGQGFKICPCKPTGLGIYQRFEQKLMELIIAEPFEKQNCIAEKIAYLNTRTFQIEKATQNLTTKVGILYSQGVLYGIVTSAGKVGLLITLFREKTES